MAKKKKDQGQNMQVRMQQRKLEEGNTELADLLNQHKGLIDHLAQRSKNDRQRQKAEAGDYMKTAKDEEELDLGSSQDGDEDEDEAQTSEDDAQEDKAGALAATSGPVIDDNLMQRNKVFFEETEKIIQQTIRDYVEKAVFDEVGNDNGSMFVVKYEQNALKMRCSKKTETFEDVIRIAAKYFGLPPNIVFIADRPANGCIFLNEQKVFEEIFPFRTAKKMGNLPALHIVLKRRMSSIDIVNNEKSLFDEKRNEEQELQKSEEAKNKAEMEQEMERMAQLEHENVMENYRSRRWWKAFFWGFVQYTIVLVLFLQLFTSTMFFLRNSESYQMRQAVISQMLEGCAFTTKDWVPPPKPSCDAYPMANITDPFNQIGYDDLVGAIQEKPGNFSSCVSGRKRIQPPDRASAAEAMLFIEQRMLQKNNFFYQNNKMLPWIQVAAYRKKKNKCHKVDGDEESKQCRESLFSQEFDESDFDGAAYQDIGGEPIKTRTLTLSPAGNRKNVKIAEWDEDEPKIFLREALLREVFCRGWLNDDVIVFTIDFNFFNMQTGILMNTKIVLKEADQGMLSMEIDTHRFTTPIGQDLGWVQIFAYLGLIANLGNIIKVFRMIKRERFQVRMLAANQEKEEKEQQADKEGAQEEEDQEEEDFDLTDIEYNNVMEAEKGGGKMFRRLKFAFKYSSRCRCFKGASITNQLTLNFNFAMISNSIWKISLRSNSDRLFKETDMNQDFYDFSKELSAANFVEIMDFLLYLLVIMVLVNFFFAWLPDVFRRINNFLSLYVNRTVLFIYLFSFLLMFVVSGLRSALDGPYLYGVNSVWYSLQRNLLVLNGGFFVESGIDAVGGISESNEAMESYTSLFWGILQQGMINFIFRFFTFNNIIALMVLYLASAAKDSARISGILTEKENREIEIEIRKDRKKAEEAAKKVKF